MKFMVNLTNIGTKARLAGAIVVILFGACNVSNKPRTIGTSSVATLDTLLLDSDGNRYPTKVLLDGNLWMAANLKLARPGSYCYGDKQENCERFGRLYTWESAKQGCTELGQGWRLPTEMNGNDWPLHMALLRVIRSKRGKKLTISYSIQ